MDTRIWMCGALLGILSLPLQGTIASAASIPSSEAARTIVIKDLTVHDGSVTGTVVNMSSGTLREVEMLLHQDWQWSNERHPGAESPGRSQSFTLNGDVAPNGSAPFTFQTTRLPERSDGRYVATMQVVSFSQVGP